MAPFDPYNTLGVPRNAGEAQIKQAYRSLSLQYHPDKNPDPEATKYFASHITKVGMHEIACMQLAVRVRPMLCPAVGFEARSKAVEAIPHPQSPPSNPGI